jgi:hypothetical protein
LIWYLYTLARYFDPTPTLWLNSLGISAIIGTGLYLSTAHASRSRTQLGRWQIFRFYLMPFCVSSFAALIKGRGFLLVFHPTLADNAMAFGVVLLFVAVVALSRVLEARPEPETREAGTRGSRRPAGDLVGVGHEYVRHEAGK